MFFRGAQGNQYPETNTPVTETEYDEALNARKPILLYFLEKGQRKFGRSDRTFLQFCALVKDDKRFGQFVRSFRGSKDLNEQVRRDILRVRHVLDAGDKAKLIAPTTVAVGLEGLELLPQLADRFSISHGHNVTDALTAQDVLRDSLNIMHAHQRCGQFAEAADIGVNLLNAFLRRCRSRGEMPTRLLPLWGFPRRVGWVSHLARLGGIAIRCSVGIGSSTEAYRMLGQPQIKNESLGLLVNCLFVSASLIEIDIQFAPFPSQLRDQRKQILRRALTLNERYSTTPRGRGASGLRQRAHLCTVMGKNNDAIKAFRQVERARENSDMGHADALAGLGLNIFLHAYRRGFPGGRRTGIRLLEEASSEIQGPQHSAWLVPVKRKLAQALLLNGDRKGAEDIVSDLHKLAHQRRLWHQAERLGAMFIDPAGYVATTRRTFGIE